MRNLLLVTSSIFGAHSKSRAIASDLVEHLRDAAEPVSVVTRDVSTLPHFDGATLAALTTAADQRSNEEASRVTLADRLIEEVEAADTIVIAAPMYNFAIPSTLKAWIDHIARAGRTFRYTEKGPEGLLKDKKVYVVASRGGLYAHGGPAAALDFQEPYLRGVFGFLGMNDVEFVYAEGLSMGEEVAAKGLAAAHAQVARIQHAAIAA
jgi:FMN-dependent NADH-azoreductase